MATIFINPRRSLANRLRDGEATLWLILVNVAVFIAAWILDALAASHPADTWLPLSASPTVAIRRPWTLLTYMVTHFSLLHILFNMLWLYWFGQMSERTVGGKRLIDAYVAGGVVGGLLYIAWAALTGRIPPNSQLVGASASVLCIMTATALRTPDLEVRLLLAGPIRLKWFALLCILLAMLGLGGGNQGGVVAHIGGVLTGVGIGLYERGALRNLEFRSRLMVNRRRMRRLHSERADRTPEPPKAEGTERLDQILDKIRISGYASLSSSEREELSRLSQELK